MLFFKQAKKHFFSREFLLFLIIGCINTFNCSFLATLFSWFLPDANIAFNFGYITSLGAAYAMNCKFIFHQPLQLQAFIKFAISYLPNYLVQNIIVFIFYNHFHLPALLTYLAAAIIGVPITFLLVKIFAFKKT